MASKRDKKRMSFLGKKNDAEKRKLMKRAAQMRRAAREPERGPKHRPDWSEAGDWDDDRQPGRVQKRRRRNDESLDVWASRIAAEEGEGGVPGTPLELDALESGLVLSASAGRCRVRLDDDGLELDCHLPPELAMFQRSELAVGDRVRVAFSSGIQGEEIDAAVAEVLPRSTSLSRPDPGPGGEHQERVIVANVDLVVVVAALLDPPLRPRLLDRYLIAVEYGGAEVAVALTKADLVESPEALQALRSELDGLARLGVPLLPVSSVDGTGLDALREAISGRTVAFVGQSGVGKSSLLNALAPELGLATRATGAAHKGRHTTTASTLYRLPNDTAIIDTPGVREFGLWEIARGDLRRYFHEFDAFAGRCRFGDCTHLHEPECAVRAALEANEIDAARFESYRRLYATLPP